MKVCLIIFLEAFQLVWSQNCSNYDFYKKDVKNFIKQCGQRTTLSFGDMSTPVIDERKFRGNEFNVFFSKLRRFEVCIRVSESKLRRVQFPAISEKYRVDCEDAFADIVIIDNDYLEEIVFGNGTVHNSFVPTLLVRGNRRLSKQSIANLHKIKVGARPSKRNSIQIYRECTVPHPLKRLDDLIGCESLHGDIVLRGKTLHPPRRPLKPFNLTGCLIVKNTQVENIDFLRNLQKHTEPSWLCDNEVINNTNLCMTDDLIAHLHTRIADLNLTLANHDCEIICIGGVITPEYISSTIAGQQCDIIKDDLIIRNWKGNGSALQHLKSIRKIIGVLRVQNSPKIEKLDFLANLQEIDASRFIRRPALKIINNSALHDLQLVSLRTVKSRAPIAIIIANNTLLNIDVNEWYELAGGENRTQLLMTEAEKEESQDTTPLLPKEMIAAMGASLLAFVALLICCCCRQTRWEKFSGMTPVGTTPAK